MKLFPSIYYASFHPHLSLFGVEVLNKKSCQNYFFSHSDPFYNLKIMKATDLISSENCIFVNKCFS